MPARLFHGCGPLTRLRCSTTLSLPRGGPRRVPREDNPELPEEERMTRPTWLKRHLCVVAAALGLIGAAPGVEAQTIKIAAGVPLTGALAKQGQEVANAVKLAAEEWNKKGGVLGRKIEVLEADDQPDLVRVRLAAVDRVKEKALDLPLLELLHDVLHLLERTGLVLHPGDGSEHGAPLQSKRTWREHFRPSMTAAELGILSRVSSPTRLVQALRWWSARSAPATWPAHPASPAAR